jgi:acetyl-CoA acetyltransferase
MSMMQPSGPGPFAKRTDRQGAKRLPNAGYGEQKEFQEQQAGAPMAKSQGPRPGVSDLMASVVPLNAPSRRPDEPVTAGVDAGPGPGREVLGIKSPTDAQLEDLARIAKYMPLMMQFADSPQSSGTMKAFVKYLRSQSE